ncbi:TonB-dependent siderophore receptor [Ectopseudomonas hydrolytica]|uniref:TonB-dependent siderophore receptor n=1 Tax=Ectopseudomonas hydrolytica TaxID=2493633 RepID=A0ABY5AB52_9GAMM|nr:TonB-dependent siderophore receptor [Pseudomonas hydrolytica]USR40636.1 TonB-dependent siderophore receptor [Pseudomonas hydrolytica]
MSDKHNKRAPFPQRHLLASAVGLALLSGFAVAKESAVELGDVTVQGQQENGLKVDKASSPKQTAALLDTPQTVNVIPETLFRQQNARTLTDVLKNTPGISFNAGENGFASGTNNFSLRGFDTSGSIFVDGARDNGSYTRDVFNVEQVEVFKGPAADNGRGGAGGYVNQVTKTPTLESFIAGGASFGFDQYDSEPRRRATLDTNQIINDSTALRLNLLVEDSGVAGREHAEKNSWGFAPSLAFGLGTETRAILAYEHVEMNDRPDWGVSGASVKGMKGDTPYNPALSGVDRDEFYGLKSDFDDTTSDALLVRLEHDLSTGMTLSNQTRWARVDRQARYTVPFQYLGGTQLRTDTQFYDRVNTSLSNLTNLSAQFATGSIKHNLAAGLELTREEAEAGTYAEVNPGNTDIFDPDWERSGPVSKRSRLRERSDVNVDTVALYVYDTLEFTPQWQLTGGLRLEQYDVDIRSRNVQTGAAVGADGFDDREFSIGGKLGLVYKPAQNGSVYAAYGVSTQPPGSYLSNPDISRVNGQAFPGFVDGADPVRAHNYEIGTKWDFFDKRLSTTAALFYTEKKKVAITGRDVGETSDSLKGYGEQVVKGLELGASGKITDNWDVFAGIVFMDSERKHSAYLDEVRRRANPGDYGAAQRTDGDELAFTPKVSGNLWTTYRLPVGLTLGLGAQHVGSSYLGRPDDASRIVANGLYGKLPSYTTFAAMASYEVNQNVDVRLNIDNLTNEEYAVSSNWNGRRVMLGDPRTFTLSTNFHF